MSRSKHAPHAPAGLERMIVIGSAEYDALFAADPMPVAERDGNDLAWLLATAPDARFRDGPRAVEHATRACELSGWRDAAALDTLAAAYAETPAAKNMYPNWEQVE